MAKKPAAARKESENISALKKRIEELEKENAKLAEALRHAQKYR